MLLHDHLELFHEKGVRMAGVTSFAVIQYLSSQGPATQKVLSEALSIPQASISRALRESPGIVRNDRVTPAVYSFDPGAIVNPMSNSAGPIIPNDTGVIRPDGSISLSGARLVPKPDTLAKHDWPAMAKHIDSYFVEMTRRGSLTTRNKESLARVAKSLDDMAYTISCRIEKGDFDGSST